MVVIELSKDGRGRPSVLTTDGIFSFEFTVAKFIKEFKLREDVALVGGACAC